MTKAVVPAEWAPQKAIWTAWPWDAGEWNGNLDAPRRDVAALVRALSTENNVRLLVHGPEAEESARAALGQAADLVPAAYGDIWLRDTGPIFARTAEGGSVALRFNVNGWGGKHDLADDATVGDRIADLAGADIRRFDFVLEGGAVDHDGEGTVLATRQTLLNPNRNGWDEAAAEAALAEAFGAKVIWVDEGLLGDHTDGHIDNIARFVAPGRVVCQAPAGADDPNAAVLDAIADGLARQTDAAGRTLEVIRVPGPGLVKDASGNVLPASHMNFIIANGIVVVPVYGTATQEAALAALSGVFPDRSVVGVPSSGVLGSGGAGGGSFHCITQQEPL